MARTLKFAALAAALMLSASVVGASAFTSAEITRDTQVTVSDDSAAGVTLAAGDGEVAKTTGGKLELSATDLNRQATFGYDGAFSITLPGSSSDEYTVSFDDTNTAFSVNSVTDSSGKALTADSGSYTLEGDETYTVDVSVTTGDAGDSGTITIDVTK